MSSSNYFVNSNDRSGKAASTKYNSKEEKVSLKKEEIEIGYSTEGKEISQDPSEDYNSQSVLQKVIQSSIEIDENIVKEIIRPSKRRSRSNNKSPANIGRKHERSYRTHSSSAVFQEKCRFILIAAPASSCYCCCHRRKKRF